MLGADGELAKEIPAMAVTLWYTVAPDWTLNKTGRHEQLELHLTRRAEANKSGAWDVALALYLGDITPLPRVSEAAPYTKLMPRG
jgi:hypothetical protein